MHRQFTGFLSAATLIVASLSALTAAHAAAPIVDSGSPLAGDAPAPWTVQRLADTAGEPDNGPDASGYRDPGVHTVAASTPVPAPATLLMLAIALVGVRVWRWLTFTRPA